MNKLISFRELIDLEPKPKQVKFDTSIYDVKSSRDGEYDYYSEQETEFLTDRMDFIIMKEPNIEIIEEDKPLIEKIGIQDFSSYQNGMTKKDREKLDNNFRTIDLILNELCKNTTYITKEDVVIEELTDTAYSDETFGYNWDIKESILKDKINEIIDLLNKKEGK